MKRFKKPAAALAALVVVIALALFLGVRSQGGRSELGFARVAVDSDGVPTIDAADWEKAVEAQGYVTASERLWQMDLMRRFVAGRLSEWYGNNPLTIKVDTRRKSEDWEGVAERALGDMSPSEKTFCEAYARGVNRFVQDRRNRWGIEYVILRTSPEPWSCKDSLLVYLSMAEDLSGKADWETYNTVWRRALGPQWSTFLYPQSHPWNEPLFGKKDSLVLPPVSAFLPERALTREELHLAEEPASSKGSNGWVWSGPTGAFLANDPHLGLTIPMIWYFTRLRVSEKEWVVGASIPGIPGVVLGMNSKFAWGFTNSMEDVDDYLKEELSPDGAQYVESVKGGKKVFAPVVQRDIPLKVRGGPDRTVRARFTKRGPLSEPEFLGGPHSRQWLGFQKGIIRLPTLAVASASSWEDLNAAFDAMGSPAVSVLFLDRKGNSGYRLTGRGVKRRVSGLEAQSALVGEWQGIEPPSLRHRKHFLAPLDGKAVQIVSANQRMWTGDYGHYFCGDNRARRIREGLASSPEQTREAMEHLQEDTVSERHKELLNWIASHATRADMVPVAWSRWSGSAHENAELFTTAVHLDRLLKALVLGRLGRAFLPPDRKNMRYRWNLSSAWVTMLLTRTGFKPLGLKDAEVADTLLEEALKAPAGTYQEENRWEAQHPFANAVPVVGRWFRMDSTPQIGFADLVRTEEKKSGSSIRLVWDLKHPEESTWIMPVGQSGHVASAHFRDLQEPWFAGRRLKVFSDRKGWGFSE